MKLNDYSKPYFKLVSQIAQNVAPYGLLAIVAISTLLGREFYRLRPQALILCLPIFLILNIVHIKLNSLENQYIEAALQHTNGKTGPNKQKSFLAFEKNIYLLIYFVSDVITSFELSSILTLAVFNFNILYVYTALFPISVLYSLFIHTTYRLPEYNNQYQKFEHIMLGESVKVPVSTSMASLSTFFCFIASMALESYFIPSLTFFLLGIFCSLRYLRQNIYTFKGLYLFHFSMQRLNHFNQLLFHQLSLFNIYIPLPNIIFYTNIAVNSLALLYAGAYLYSTERSEHIKQLYYNTPPEIEKPEPEHNYDPNIAKAHP